MGDVKPVMELEVRTPFGRDQIKNAVQVMTTEDSDSDLWIFGPGNEFRAVYANGEWASVVRVDEVTSSDA